MAGNHRHRRPRARMVSLPPLLKPSLQIKIGQSSKTRNLPHALGVGAVTGIAGHDIGFRNSPQINRSAPGGEIPGAVIGGLRSDLSEIDCQVVSRVGTERRHGAPTYIVLKMDYPACAR